MTAPGAPGALERAPRTIGPVTMGAGVGSVSLATVGASLASLIVHAWPSLEDVRDPITILLTAALTLAGALVGGWLVRAPEPDTAATRAAAEADARVAEVQEARAEGAAVQDPEVPSVDAVVASTLEDPPRR